MNKKRFIKIISIFLIVLFTCFSSFQLHKTYSKAVAPLLAIPFGVELLFNLAATAFVTNAVYQMGSEAKKIYDDWQNNKNDDEKKAQYTHWGNELKNSMTSEEVENSLNSAVNVVDGAVGLTLSSKSYQEFIENVNKDRQKNLSFSFSSYNEYFTLYNNFKQHVSSSCCAAKFPNKVYNYYVVVYVTSQWLSSHGLGGKYGFAYFGSYSPISITSSTNCFSSDSLYLYDYYACRNSSDHYNSSASQYYGPVGNNISFPIVDYNFSSDVNIGSETTEFETSQPDFEIKANPDYDSTVSVSIPTTEISPEQLTESPYKENSESFEYPDAFESTVNNTTINNEYNKNPIKEENEGLLDYGDTVNLDFSPLYGAVEDKFPFCIPFDLFHAIDTLTADKEKPEFTITFPSIAGSKPTSFTFNFDDYELVIEIFRYFVLLAFCIGLVINTKKILGGS